MIIVLVTHQPLTRSRPSLVMHCSTINLAVSPNHIIAVQNGDTVTAHVRTSSKPPIQSEIHDLLKALYHMCNTLQISVLFVYRLMHMNMSVGAVLDWGGPNTEHMPMYIQYIAT